MTICTHERLNEEGICRTCGSDCSGIYQAGYAQEIKVGDRLDGPSCHDDSKPCTCGSSPIRYQGSHILPSNRDERGGHIDLAAIPPHITRDGRDDKPEKGQWHPWLRVGVASKEQDCGETVILTRKQVENLRDTLSEWLRDS